MNFSEKLEEKFEDNYNKTVTENGALMYKTTNKALLDFFFKVSSYRNTDESKIKKDFDKAYHENPELATLFTFFIRDARGGLGERRLFRILFNYLSEVDFDSFSKLLDLVPEYGRWDDLFEFSSDKAFNAAFEVINKQLSNDFKNYYDNKPVSLLAKWMPSINTSSQKTRKLARKFINKLQVTDKYYRQNIALLRSKIKIVEKYMSSNNWDKIKYEEVPSRANLIYKDAFLKHDEDRRTEYLKALSLGKTKINSSVLYPHDIVVKCSPGSDDTVLDSMWNNLAKSDEIRNTIVVSDGSGSMYNPRLNPQPINVAVALAIYFAENTKGEFHNKFITFSEDPRLIDISGHKTIRSKVNYVKKFNEIANTNIEKVFDLILETAIENKLTQKDIPNILIISDMEFDNATSGRVGDRLFQSVRSRYNDVGLQLPRLIFWNVASRTGAIPLIENPLGVALVSGFSQSIADMIISSNLDPYKLLVDKLRSSRYKKVAERVGL